LETRTRKSLLDVKKTSSERRAQRKIKECEDVDSEPLAKAHNHAGGFRREKNPVGAGKSMGFGAKSNQQRPFQGRLRAEECIDRRIKLKGLEEDPS